MHEYERKLIARDFARKDFPPEVEAKEEYFFTQKDIGRNSVAPLAANRCIKVTIEYSDIPEKENNV